MAKKQEPVRPCPANRHPWRVTTWRQVRTERIGLRHRITGVIEDADCPCGAKIRKGKIVRREVGE